MNTTALQLLYAELNRQYFDDILPACRIVWSRQLTRAAGNIDVRRAVIKLSVPLLQNAFRRDGLFPHEYSICGVLCDSAESATREILKHEMIHLWLHVQGLPSGHTAQFRAKAKSIGQPKTRHGIALPTPRNGWIYSCGHCGGEFKRRRRYGRAEACLACCKKHNGGKFDARFKLHGRKIVSG